MLSLIIYIERKESSAGPDRVGLGGPDPLEITNL